MKKLTVLPMLGILLLLGGCASVSVQTDFDQEADFGKYTTFKWVPADRRPENKSKLDNSLNRARIIRAVNRELEAKGFREVRKGKADLLVNYFIGVHDKVNVTTVGYGTWRRPYRRVTYHYKESTLTIDLVDPGLKQLVWRGSGSDVIARRDNIEKRINDAVKAILKKFPPK